MTHFLLNKNENNNYYSHYFHTPLGQILAISTEEALIFFEFIDWKGLKKALNKLKIEDKDLISFKSPPLQSIEEELQSYFSGNLKSFKTPLLPLGTFFQKSVWNELLKIPYGKTISYLSLAKHVNKPSAYRAVANANGCNPFAIIVPCHRVINENGNLGGYGGGLHRKKWLLDHEKKYSLL